jgi:hypothetical protein
VPKISTSTISTNSNEFKEIVIPPKPIPELYVDRSSKPQKQIVISPEEIQKIKIKVKPVRNWVLAWKSEGSGARYNASVSFS